MTTTNNTEFCATCSTTIVWMPSDEHPQGGQWVDLQGRPSVPKGVGQDAHTHTPEGRTA